MITLVVILLSVLSYTFLRSMFNAAGLIEQDIYSKLVKNKNTISFRGYEFPPFVFRDEWMKVIEEVSVNEDWCPSTVVIGQYITIRMRINRMKKLRESLSALDISFEELMKTITMNTMKKFVAEWGFTHDGVIVLVIPFTSNYYGGKRDKFLTSVISYTSGQLYNLINKNTTTKLATLPIVSGRISVTNSLLDAMKPLLWCSYISGVNGISIKLNNLQSDENTDEYNCNAKLGKLIENNLLPLTDHEAYGLLLHRIKEPVFCGLKENANGYYMRTRYKIHKGNILNYLPEYLMKKCF